MFIGHQSLVVVERQPDGMGCGAVAGEAEPQVPGSSGLAEHDAGIGIAARRTRQVLDVLHGMILTRILVDIA
jgi:hypothetical protein